MKPRQLNLYVSSFAYGGNGGISTEVPNTRVWAINTVNAMRNDDRIGHVDWETLSDTPVTLTRNRAVLNARAAKADVLIMCDSDQWPDMYVGQDPLAKPFFSEAFKFLYDNYDKGPHVIAAPYCGPPPHENVYVFRWGSWETQNPNVDFKLDQYTREESVSMSGIQPAAALPTGLSMFDMRIFDVVEKCEPELIRKRGWFYYEFGPYAANKDSTEDVTATRDMSLAGCAHLGYNPVHCAWDSWAGHWKPKCVGKPSLVMADQVAGLFRDGAARLRSDQKRIIIKTDYAKRWDSIPDPNDGNYPTNGHVQKPANDAGAVAAVAVPGP